jgi:hypothetical protein
MKNACRIEPVACSAGVIRSRTILANEPMYENGLPAVGPA